MFAPVEFWTEFHAVFSYFEKWGKRKNLKAARIGEDGIVPVHKAVETAEIL